MKLRQIFEDLIGPELRVHDSREWENIEFDNLTDDSRKTNRASIFFALRGPTSDGHEFLDRAVKKSPVAVCVEDVSRVPAEYEGIVFESECTRQLLAKTSYKFFGSPADDWMNVAVTGTNGKTTVVHLIEHIFNQLGQPTAVIGTVDHHFGRKTWPTQLTTPGSLELMSRLRDFKQMGAKALAMEVSSHALVQKRAHGIPFKIGVFTNLSRDHLDYHPTMESYYQAKRILFIDLLHQKQSVGAVINADDEYGRRLASDIKVPVLTFGSDQADLIWKVNDETFEGSQFEVQFKNESYRVETSIPCRHNMSNVVAALGTAVLSGLELNRAIDAIKSFRAVKGRLEPIKNKKGIHVFVDYAHTDDALGSVLRSLKSLRDKRADASRILTVFGCGGDRDKGKRGLMFQAAHRYSDHIFVTSDNPRNEDPNAIIDDILHGNTDLRQVTREVDRRLAIRRALEMAETGDVVLIAGKGHEDYQIVGSERLPFSDRAVVEEYFK